MHCLSTITVVILIEFAHHFFGNRAISISKRFIDQSIAAVRVFSKDKASIEVNYLTQRSMLGMQPVLGFLALVSHFHIHDKAANAAIAHIPGTNLTSQPIQRPIHTLKWYFLIFMDITFQTALMNILPVFSDFGENFVVIFANNILF